MNKLLKFCAIAALAIQPAPGQQEKDGPVFRDAATHDQLADKYRESKPRKALEDAVGRTRPDPTKENQPRDLISSSDIISFNGLTTLVPKRAILRIPENYRDRIDNHHKSNRIVNWLEFYSHNRGWITTVEVSRAQAEGREPFAEELIKQLEKNRNLIIATYSTGPISVLPLKESGEAPLTTSEEPQTQP